MSLLAYLENKPDLDAAPAFGAIIGEKPSQGARSPSLWNAVFEEQKIATKFLPFDVSSDNLPSLMAALRKEPRYIGGAVAVPYKTAIPSLLDDVDPVARQIGAVNAIYRKDGGLCGTNTDGEGAVSVLRSNLAHPRLQSINVMVLGAGGTGAAVASYIADDLGASGALLICNRRAQPAQALARRLNAKAISWPPPARDLADLNVLINCTSAGYAPGDQPDANPNRFRTAMSAEQRSTANIRESVGALAALPRECRVFDVVYQPRDTVLLALAEGLGLGTIGGVAMNLEQAVIAFNKAVPSVPIDVVRKIMAAVP